MITCKSDVQANATDPGFLAPELFLEEAPYTTASDFWALGCIVFQLATGRLPFGRVSKSQMAHHLLQAKLQRPTGKLKPHCPCTVFVFGMRPANLLNTLGET